MLWWFLTVGFAGLWITWLLLWITARGHEAIAMADQKTARESERIANEFAIQQKNIADQRLQIIEAVEKQRGRIWDMYFQSVSGAGQAQAWLLEELERIRRYHNLLAKKHGFEKYEISDRVRRAVGEFKESHTDKGKIAQKKQLLLTPTAAGVTPKA